MADTMVITRKIALIPVASERKEWKKRINAFLEKDFPRKTEILRSHGVEVLALLLKDLEKH